MTISVTNIGSGGSTASNASIAITVPVGGIPAAASVFVGVSEGSTAQTTAGALVSTVTGSSVFVEISGARNNAAANGVGGFYYQVRNSAAYSSGNTITYTKNTTVSAVAISGFYVTGLSTIPTTSTQTDFTFSTFGNSTTVSISNAAGPVRGGELYVGFLAGSSALTGFTQSTSTSWATPFISTAVRNNTGGSGLGAGVGGGFVVHPSTSVLAFTGDPSSASAWWGALAAFKQNVDPLTIGSGGYTFTGSNANLVRTAKMTITTGSCVVTGNAVTITRFIPSGPLTPSNAFPALPFPQHSLGKSTVQDFIYPGGVQTQITGLSVLSYTNAFPGIAFPQHKSAQTTTVQDYLYPGGAQPKQPAVQPKITITTGSYGLTFSSEAVKKASRANLLTIEYYQRPTAFSPFTSSFITVTGLTTTRNAVSGGAYGTYMILSIPPVGKYYCEANIDANTGNSGIGLGNDENDWTILGQYVGHDGISVGYFADGTIVCNAAVIGNSTVWAVGQKIRMAVDAAKSLIWFTVGAGAWNGSGTADPASGAGGITYGFPSAGFYPPTAPIFLGVSLLNTGDQLTLNFGSTAYAFTTPTGFDNFTAPHSPTKLLKGAKEIPQTGSYSVTPSLLVNKKTSIDNTQAGSYALTPNQLLKVNKGARSSVQAGSYLATGEQLTAKATRMLKSQTASYTFTPEFVILSKTLIDRIQAGSYALTPDQLLNLNKGSRSNIQAGSYALTPDQLLNLTKTSVNRLQAGSYSLTGESELLRKASLLLAQMTPYAFTGESLTFTLTTIVAFSLSITTGTYALTGETLTLLKSSSLGVQAGTYALTGENLRQVRAAKLVNTAGFYTVTGEQITLRAARTAKAQTGFYGYADETKRLGAETLRKASLAALQDGLYALTPDQLLNVNKVSRIVAQSGSYALTGERISLLKASRSNLQAGFYSVIGPSVSLSIPGFFSLTLVTGLYSLAGENLTLLKTSRDSVQAGTYTLTGEQLRTLKGSRMNDTSGTYTLIGEQLTLRAGRFVGAQPGTYALTGEAERLLKGSRDNIQTGSYALTGENAALARGARLGVSLGTYALTGENELLRATRLLNAQAGFYSLTGESLVLTPTAALQFQLVLGTGTYLLTGESLTLRKTSRLGVQTGTYSLAGEALQALKGSRLVNTTGTYSLTGNVLRLNAGHLVRPQTAFYGLTGENALLLKTWRERLQTGFYTLTGESEVLAHGRTMPIGAGFYSLTGEQVRELYARLSKLAPGLYTITGHSAGLTPAGGRFHAFTAWPTLLGSELSVNLTAETGITLIGRGVVSPITITPAQALLGLDGASVLVWPDGTVTVIPPGSIITGTGQ